MHFHAPAMILYLSMHEDAPRGTNRVRMKRKNNGIETWWWPFATYRYRSKASLDVEPYSGYTAKELQGTDFLVACITSTKTLQFFVPECLNQFFAIERAGP